MHVTRSYYLRPLPLFVISHNLGGGKIDPFVSYHQSFGIKGEKLMGKLYSYEAFGRLCGRDKILIPLAIHHPLVHAQLFVSVRCIAFGLKSRLGVWNVGHLGQSNMHLCVSVEQMIYRGVILNA